MTENYEIPIENHENVDDSYKILKIYCCEISYFKLILFILLSFTLIPLLMILWYPKIRRFLLYSFCNFEDCTHLAIYGPEDMFELVNIEETIIKANCEPKKIRKFCYKFYQFFWDSVKGKMMPIKLDCKKPYETIRNTMAEGIKSFEEQQNLLNFYGPCLIDVPYKGICGILFEEVLTPFYLFQIASVILWFLFEYMYYASAIIIMSVLSVSAEVYETRRNLLKIREMAIYECKINIKRGEKYEEINSINLIPGDIIEIPDATRMPCDCILLEGNVVVNEAMLTGESVPVVKSALPNLQNIYNPEEDKKYTIFSGTEIVQTRSAEGTKTIGLVIHTGFSTMKGALVRYIIYPKAPNFSFYTDSYKYILVMFCLSFIGILALLLNNESNDTLIIVLKCLDLITITVPPALPACMSIGINFALNRLKNEQIYCISPPRINVAGKINVFCFDKTGTLTEDGLSIDGFRPMEKLTEKDISFSSFINSANALLSTKITEINDSISKEILKKRFLEGLATCHSVAVAKGKLIGDPLDVEMFISTNWNLIEVNGRPDLVCTIINPKESLDKNSEYKLGIFRRLDFTSKLQRMSVFVKHFNNNNFCLYTKGSPEKIAELCKSSTIPQNYNEILTIYTQKGCRVLALAYKPINLGLEECMKIERSDIEKDLEFTGFLIMRNSLKKPTASVISVLQNANIRPVMATGDNAFTAITVAQECGIISNDSKIYLIDLLEGENGRRNLKCDIISQGKNETKNVQENLREENTPIIKNSLEKIHLSEAQNNTLIGIVPDSIENSQNISRIYPVSPEIIQNTSVRIKESMRFPWDELDENIDFSLALTGKAWEFIIQQDPKCTSKSTQAMLAHASVFARMSPESKASLVEAFQNMNYTVGMCGDGANDCVALKGADIGISLSDAEASIAAPFTSKIPDITCVPKVLREGRCALTTSFQCFKFMALYSMIQFCSVSIMYYLGRNLSDLQFMMVDFFYILPLAITMSWTKAANKLSKQRPVSDLLSGAALCSVIGQVILQVGWQFWAYFYVKDMPWYKDPPSEDEVDSRDPDGNFCHANTAVYLVSLMQYISVVLAFSIGKPFRKPMDSNIPFIINLVIAFIYTMYIILIPDDWHKMVFGLDYDLYFDLRADNFLAIIGFAVLVNCFITYAYEMLLNRIFSNKPKKIEIPISNK